MRTGGAIKYAEQLIGHEEPFLVLNGDIFYYNTLQEFINQHKKKMQ
jgi:NDP-sugar pyrophosphorylase family protein